MDVWVTLVDVVLLCLAMAVLLPSVILLVECAAAWLPARKSAAAGNTSGPKSPVAVLIPAHNEALSLPATLKALMPQMMPDDRVLVVADNCSDTTADIARSAGATALERVDQVRRGKGYALAAGIDELSRTVKPDVLILLDADVAPPDGMIARLAEVARATRRPVQAVYLLQSPEKASPRTAVSELAFITKNLTRPTGLHRLGQPVLLTGTGIALPWEVLKDVNLASGDLVEDMKLGLDLLRAGHPPMLCPDVVIRGLLPDSGKTAYTQRTRWEHGHLATMLKFVPALLADALRGRSGALALALDLLVPPLAMLVAASGLLLGACLVWGWLGGSLLSSATVAAALLLVTVAVLLSWAKAARHLPLWNIAVVPFYILWKVPLYARFLLGKRQGTWVRTDRTSP